jgi:hypothetical protein
MMRRRIGSLVAVGVLVVTALGAGAPVGAVAAPVAGSVQQVYRAGGFGTPSTPIEGYSGELLGLQAVDVGMTAAEPTVGVDRDGVAYFAASTLVVETNQVWGVAQTHVMRSLDGGLSWTRVQQSVPAANVSLPPGNADPFVWVDQDTGRVFNIDLYGGCSWLNYSDTKGDSWLVSPAACGMPVNDHQTIGAGKPRGDVQTGLDYPNVLYYCVNQILQSACGRSLDGGVVWTPTRGVPFPNGSPGCGGLTGHVRSDPDGRIFLPSGECVAISSDNGDTWTRSRALPAGLDTPIPHTSVASDDAGNLYFVAIVPSGSGSTTKYLPYLTTSTDHGATWSAPKMIAPPGINHANFPVVAAGDAGKIVINFPGSSHVSGGEVRANVWNQYVVVSEDALADDPVFLSATANDPADPVHRGICRGRCGGMWDFIDVTVSPQGEAWAAASDDCINACVVPGTLGAEKVGRGIAIRQISGPRLRG